MRQSILDGAAQRAATLARQALAAGMEPLEAIERGCVPGMDEMGALYGRREAFLPDLVMAGEAMKAAMAVLEPEIQKRGGARHFRGRVVLGTVKGDTHEIGKNLVGILLSANGFEVHDLGVNVAAEAFVAKAREVKADLVGASALLTTTTPALGGHRPGVARGLASERSAGQLCPCPKTSGGTGRRLHAAGAST